MTHADGQTADIITIYLRVAPPDIALVKFLFESYEEVGLLRTVDQRTAIVVLLVAADFIAAARAIVGELQEKIGCVEVERPADEGDDWLMREID
jgi:hypothetical protein